MRNSQLLYSMNSVCMLGVSLILSGAFYFQFGLHETPVRSACSREWVCSA